MGTKEIAIMRINGNIAERLDDIVPKRKGDIRTKKKIQRHQILIFCRDHKTLFQREEKNDQMNKRCCFQENKKYKSRENILLHIDQTYCYQEIFKGTKGLFVNPPFILLLIKTYYIVPERTQHIVPEI